MSTLLEIPEVRARLSLVSVQEYHRQREFNDHGRRTELVRGVVIEKTSKSPLHSAIASRLFRKLTTQGPGWTCRKEEPLTFADSEPEPDIAIVHPSKDDFAAAHPSTAILVAEIAVTSAALDRENCNLYAENGVTEYWIVLPREGVVEVYTSPTDGCYREMLIIASPEVLTSAKLPGVAVDLTELFAGA